MKICLIISINVSQKLEEWRPCSVSLGLFDSSFQTLQLPFTSGLSSGRFFVGLLWSTFNVSGSWRPLRWQHQSYSRFEVKRLKAFFSSVLWTSCSDCVPGDCVSLSCASSMRCNVNIHLKDRKSLGFIYFSYFYCNNSFISQYNHKISIIISCPCNYSLVYFFVQTMTKK